MTYHVQFLLLVLAGWVNRQQQDVIDYLQEENRVLRAGPHLDQNVLACYAPVAPASILDPSGGLFSDAARPCQRPAPPCGANVALENRD